MMSASARTRDKRQTRLGQHHDKLIDMHEHVGDKLHEFMRFGSQLRQVDLVGFDVQRDLAHSVDDVIENVGEPHRIGNVEAHDERVVEQLVDLGDDLVGLMLEGDDPLRILPVGLAEVSGAVLGDIGETLEEGGILVVARWPEQVRQGALDRLFHCWTPIEQAARRARIVHPQAWCLRRRLDPEQRAFG